MEISPELADRFWSHVNQTETCWLWTASLNGFGYGKFGITRSKTVLAHRFSYELLVGPIPEGFQLDHVRNNGCISRACVKSIADEYGPSHLEPVTARENTLRGAGIAAINAQKMVCKWGHPLYGLNVHVRRDGRRECKECKLQKNRESYRRVKESR